MALFVKSISVAGVLRTYLLKLHLAYSLRQKSAAFLTYQQNTFEGSDERLTNDPHPTKTYDTSDIWGTCLSFKYQ